MHRNSSVGKCQATAFGMALMWDHSKYPSTQPSIRWSLFAKEWDKQDFDHQTKCNTPVAGGNIQQLNQYSESFCVQLCLVGNHWKTCSGSILDQIYKIVIFCFTIFRSRSWAFWGLRWLDWNWWICVWNILFKSKFFIIHPPPELLPLLWPWEWWRATFTWCSPAV